MSYGTTGYGTSPYGGVLGPLTIVSAFPVGARTIRVTLSKAPLASSPQAVGSVLNPRTWKVVRTDTNVGFTVLSVSEFDAPLIWDVSVLEPLGDADVTHRISSETLVDSTGSPIDAPRYFDFPGMLAAAVRTNDRIAASRGFVTRDIQNRWAPTVDGEPGGVFVIADDNDYALDEANTLLRKLIIRRITTPRGGFRHLPQYGLGLQVKEPLPTGDIISFQKEASDQIRQEPDVESVRVQVRQSGGKMTLIVRAKNTQRQEVAVSLERGF